MTTTTMRWTALAASSLALAGGLAACGGREPAAEAVQAPAAQQAAHLPRGWATVVSAEDVKAVMDTLGKQQNIDKVVHTMDTNGPAGHISIAAVAYNAGPQNWDGVANEHSKITEVFHVTQGSATFVFGGDLEDAREFDTSFEAVRKVFGPGRGGRVHGHRIVKAKVGDNVILPPNTPHNIIEVTEDFKMIVVRIDPEKVLEVGPAEELAAASPEGPWIGTWKRNAEKSEGQFAGNAIFKMWPEGDRFGYSMDMTSASGEPVRMEGAARFDGKPYPEKGNAMADHNAFTRLDERSYRVIDYKEGKETIRFDVTISPDGKTRTSVSTMRDAQGNEVKSKAVWDRVE